MFQRFFDEGLAQASFLVGCDRTKQAVVIDPRRDAAIYTAASARSGATTVFDDRPRASREPDAAAHGAHC